MALSRKRRLTIACSLLAAVCAAGLVFEATNAYRIARFNQSLGRSAAAAAALEGSDYGAFARAWQLQQQRDFDAALRGYASIETTDAPALRTAVRFNMANLYLQRALEAYRQGEQDMATPLVELAKQSYRDLLRSDSRHWGAKYNLELTLRLLPDVEAQESLAERNPERSPRAAGAVEIYRQLP